MGMIDFANHIIAVAYENKLSVSNLHLQKIMYFTMREHKEDLSLLKDIYDEPFCVWRYGPVVPEIYKEFKGYGSRAIIEEGKKNINFDNFNDTILALLNRDPFDLVEESHSHEFWQKNEDKLKYGTSDIEYSLEDIING